jgi:hypothetical protein
MRTTEDMKKEAQKIGGASERAYGEKVAVGYETYQRMFVWTVNDTFASETEAQACLQRMAEREQRSGGEWPAAFGR